MFRGQERSFPMDRIKRVDDRIDHAAFIRFNSFDARMIISMESSTTSRQITKPVIPIR